MSYRFLMSGVILFGILLGVFVNQTVGIAVLIGGGLLVLGLAASSLLARRR